MTKPLGNLSMQVGKSFLVLALVATAAARLTAEASPLTVTGEVTTPLSLDPSDLGGTTVSATVGGVLYSGSTVYSLITDAGFLNNPAQAKNGNLLDYISISGAGGQSVALSEGQIDPKFGGQAANPQTFIATSANGSPIAPRLIVQTDPNGLTNGYDVVNVSNIKVGWANVPALSNSALNNPSTFTVTGAITNPPVAYNTSNFGTAFPSQTTQTVTYLAGGTPTTQTFTGPPIYSVLQAAGLIVTGDPQSILNDYIVVTGSNEPTPGPPLDYAVVYSLGEIDPDYNDFTSDTIPLIAEIGGASFRSTAPSDSFGGRYNSQVVNIDVVDTIAEPGSLALMLTPLTVFFAFNRRWRRRQA